jgi:hypothetical protein
MNGNRVRMVENDCSAVCFRFPAKKLKSMSELDAVDAFAALAFIGVLVGIALAIVRLSRLARGKFEDASFALEDLKASAAEIGQIAL